MLKSIYDLDIKELPDRFRVSVSVPSFGEFPCLPVVGDTVIFDTSYGVCEFVVQSVFSRRSGFFVKAKNSSRFLRSVYVFPLSLLSPCGNISNDRVAFSLDQNDFFAWKNFCRSYRSGVKHE